MKTFFDSTQLKNTIIKNRFVKSGSWEALATPEGHMTQELYDIHEELAQGGVGMLITGYARVLEEEQPNPGMIGIFNDKFIPEYIKLTEMVHKYNTAIILQIAYGGSLSHMEPLSPVIWAPSAIKNESTGVMPTAMTKENIAYLTKAFVDSARRAKEAGFDGIQIHSAHGYLLSQFLSPKFNVREDEYGGSIENRCRIHLEIYNAVRKEVGDDFLILIKINSQDYCDNGLTSEDSIEVCKKLSALGIDAIEVSGGNEGALQVSKHNLGPARTKITKDTTKESYFKEHAIRLSKEVQTPIILTGGNRHTNIMEEILTTSNIAYFGFTRPLVREPNIIHTWEKDIKAVPLCVSCNRCYHTHGKRCIFNLRDAGLV